VLKCHRHRVDIEHNICYEVGPLVAPVCDDWLITELEAHNLFKAVLIALTLVSDLHDPLQTSFSGHELEDGVHY